MSTLWPWFLLLLLLLPLLVAVYIWQLRRKRRYVVRYSSLSLLRDAVPKANWQRHLPFACFLLALGCLIGALARPVALVQVPSSQTTIILALDVSRSMCSTDINPNRLVAAKNAAVNFIDRQRPGTQIGIVAFAGYAELVQPPTTDAEILEEAIAGLLTGNRTAIGSGIMKSIDAIAEIDPTIPRTVAPGSLAPQPTPVAKGAYAPDIIVLLTDGASNAGTPPLVAAQQAADRGIRVYTIGFGTARGGEMPNCNPGVQGSEPVFGGPPVGPGGFGGGGGGGNFRRGIDEETLKKVAALTDGKYYSAESAAELVNVFNSLPTSLITKTKVTEISVGFAAVGALFALLAIVLSWRRHPLF